MDKKELIQKVNEELRAAGHKKPIALERHSFYITDKFGNSAEFVVKEKDREVIYTAADVRKVIDACVEVILRAIQNGESVNIFGFGTFKVVTRKKSRTNNVRTGEIIEVPAHAVPCFISGERLKRAAKIYGRTNLQSNNTEEGDE